MTAAACGAIINSPCALEAIDAEEVDTELDGALCVSNSGCARCHHVSVCRTHKDRREKGDSSLDGGQKGRLTALVQDDTPGLFQLPDDWAGAVASGLDNVDALVDDGLGIGAIVRRVEGRQEGDVDAEGVLG